LSNTPSRMATSVPVNIAVQLCSLAARAGITIAILAGPVRQSCEASSFELTATPQHALFDVLVDIRARVPKSNQRVTIEASASIDGVLYHSWATYQTDGLGSLDLEKSAPIRGTYRGVDPMGLFWSMAPVGQHAYAPPSLNEIDVRLRLEAPDVRAQATVVRLRRDPSLARTQINRDGIVGVSFVPRDKQARAVVVVLGGSEGGVDENRAAAIASHHLAALALAYFGEPSLPSALANVPLEYVDAAIVWIRQQPGLVGLPVLLEGDSKGAELALLEASRNPSVCAVVALAPSSEVFEGFSTAHGEQRASWSLGGRPVPYANNPVPAAVKAVIRGERKDGRPVSYRDQYLAIATPQQVETTIAVQRIHGPILLIAGSDDRLWPSDVFAKRILDERRVDSTPYPDKALVYAKAGHQIDVPFMPTTGLSTVVEPSFALALGGTPEGYARADADMWPTAIHFMQDACLARTRAMEPSTRELKF
jgi:dienelactone hydrolase